MVTNLKNKNISLKSRYLAVNFIGLAMIAAIFVYAGVVEFIKWQWAPFQGFATLPAQTESLLRYILLALAAAQYVIIYSEDCPGPVTGKSASGGYRYFCPVRNCSDFRAGAFPAVRQHSEFLSLHGDFPGIFLPVLSQV
jgi:hypothetical protein